MSQYVVVPAPPDGRPSRGPCGPSSFIKVLRSQALPGSAWNRSCQCCLTANGGKLTGGIGVSGGTYVQDQQIAEAAIRAIGFDL